MTRRASSWRTGSSCSASARRNGCKPMPAHPAGPRHADVLPEAHHTPPPDDVNALDAAIWPASARRVDGVVHLGGVAVPELVGEHGTPAFLLDEDDLRQRARAYVAAYDGVSVYYAGKAFLC